MKLYEKYGCTREEFVKGLRLGGYDGVAREVALGERKVTAHFVDEFFHWALTKEGFEYWSDYKCALQHVEEEEVTLDHLEHYEKHRQRFIDKLKVYLDIDVDVGPKKKLVTKFTKWVEANERA